MFEIKLCMFVAQSVMDKLIEALELVVLADYKSSQGNRIYMDNGYVYSHQMECKLPTLCVFTSTKYIHFQ